MTKTTGGWFTDSTPNTPGDLDELDKLLAVSLARRAAEEAAEERRKKREIKDKICEHPIPGFPVDDEVSENDLAEKARAVETVVKLCMELWHPLWSVREMEPPEWIKPQDENRTYPPVEASVGVQAVSQISSELKIRFRVLLECEKPSGLDHAVTVHQDFGVGQEGEAIFTIRVANDPAFAEDWNQRTGDMSI